jgi:glycine oxidase
MHRSDFCIAGAGIIGLSLALELHLRGASVAVFDRGNILSEASTAAAGMLAAGDPENPPQLRSLSALSLSLYPSFLERIEYLGGIHVPFHTTATLQALPPDLATRISEQDTLAPGTLSLLQPQLNPGDRKFLFLAENSLDPRELAAALLAAVRATRINLHPDTAVRAVRSSRETIEVETSAGVFRCSRFIDCTGAWGLSAPLLPHLRIAPRKGQMLAVSLPPSLSLHLVVRTPEIYIVPRTAASHGNRALIGATVEDAGFDKTVHPSDIARLRHLAAELLPPLADARQAETWSGLRSATDDLLPILGAIPGHPNHFIASGHYRNGILLAPATAHLMSQLLMEGTISLDLSAFSPERNPGKTAHPKPAQKARYSRISQ